MLDKIPTPRGYDRAGRAGAVHIVGRILRGERRKIRDGSLMERRREKVEAVRGFLSPDA